MLNDGTTSYQYQSWFADVFADVRLQYRDADDNFVQYVYADNTDKDRFTVGDQGLPTEGYFYVEVRAQETVESKYKDEKLYVYLSRICAEKDSDTFIWESENANSENQYFDFTADAVSGLMGGWAKIED
jgi:hypothetical protein